MTAFMPWRMRGRAAGHAHVFADHRNCRMLNRMLLCLLRCLSSIQTAGTFRLRTFHRPLRMTKNKQQRTPYYTTPTQTNTNTPCYARAQTLLLS